MSRKLLLATISFLLTVAPLRAEAPGGGPKGLGLGVILGSPSGLTGKYFISNIHALDAGLGFADDFDVYADYLWHGWKAFAQPQEGRLAAYLGVGGRVESEKGDDKVGLRGVFGAAYYLKDYPVEVSFEIVPVLNLTGGGGTDLDAGLAFRYFFTRFN